MAGWCHLGLAEVQRLRDEPKAGEEHLLRALDLFDRVGDRVHTYQCLGLIGLSAAARDDDRTAAICIASATAMQPGLGSASTVIRAEAGAGDTDAIASRLRLELPHDWARGLTMTARQVLSMLKAA